MKNLLVLLADFANGIFAVILVSYAYSIEPAWWFFLVGIVMSMSPDIDALHELWQRGRVSTSAEYTKDHRTFLHYPILAIPLGVLAVWVIGYWGAVWFVAVGLHLINDLYGTGWGLQLFWPVKRTRYKLFGRRANRLKCLLVEGDDWTQLTNDERRLRLVVSWSENEINTYITRFGVDKWIDAWYLRLNWICGVEYSLFILAMILMGLSLL